MHAESSAAAFFHLSAVILFSNINVLAVASQSFSWNDSCRFVGIVVEGTGFWKAG